MARSLRQILPTALGGFFLVILGAGLGVYLAPVPEVVQKEQPSQVKATEAPSPAFFPPVRAAMGPDQGQAPGHAESAALDNGPAFAPMLPPAPAADVRPALHYSSSVSDFSLHKLGTGQGPTLLVIGGIQGDEPGGFSAASLLTTHYTVTSGSVWVVPDLNFASILTRNRGMTGDMNRKFSALSASDPQFELVSRIKAVLLDPSVDLILNLHDGSGFYRPAWEGPLHNPNRWGQSVIIDQEEMDAPRFGRLADLARAASDDVNRALLRPEHRYFIRNTHTAMGDKEMEKSLSWFAVRNGKPAFGVEASKEFTTEYRTYYHMQVLESFMRQMGIAFARDFSLTPEGVLLALNSNLAVAPFDGRIMLPLDNVRPRLNMMPFRKGSQPQARASRPLLALVPDKSDWRVAYGNRTLTRLAPMEMEFDDSLDTVRMEVDGRVVDVPVGGVVDVARSFVVEDVPGYRVNAIGTLREVDGTEAGVVLQRSDFMPRFSVDKNATLYRVEVYTRDTNAFSGMVLVRFGTSAPSLEEPLTATKGPESEFGY